MSRHVAYNTELNIIEISFLGETKLQDIKDSFSTVLPIVKEKKCFKLLFDFREATLRVLVFEMFEFPRIVYKISTEFQVRPAALKRAVILPQKFSETRFAETLAANYGQRTSFFRDAEEAQKWLLED